MNSKHGKKFFFMVAAQVIFHVPVEGTDEVAINTATLNGIVTHDRDTFPTRMLGKAQQVAQMHFFKKLGVEATKVNVVDVVILNIMNLGYMTEAEFHAAPEGTKQQERGAQLHVIKGGSGGNAGDVLDPAAVAAESTGTLQ